MMKGVKALVCTEDQTFSLAAVELPELRPTDILLRTLYSGVSIGTELLLVRRQLSWAPFPICLGYQAIAMVEKVGRDVEGFKVGDKVYARNCSLPMRMGDQQVSPACGTHASHFLTDATNPAHGPALLPEGVDEEAASLFVMPSVGLNGVNMAGVEVGDVVAVVGVGLIGLGNVAAAKQRGAATVAIDLEPKRLEVARRIGADYIINSKDEDLQTQFARIAPTGADVVFEASGNPTCVDLAMSLCKTWGKFVFQGNYGEGPLSFEFIAAHRKRLTAFFPCDDGYPPCRQAVMKWLADGSLKWRETITHRLRAEEAPAFYDAINRGQVKDVLGAVIRWE